MLKQKINSPLQKRNYKSQLTAGLTALTMSAVPMFGFAADLISDAVVDLCNKVGTTLTNIFGPVCILILGFAIFTIIMGKNSKSADEGMSWAKRAIFGFIAFNLLGTVLRYGVGLFAGTQQWGAVTAAMGIL